MSPVRANSQNVLITTVGNVLPIIAALITAPILARSLDVTGRGELAAAVAPLILAAAGLTLGAPEAITYYIARRQSGFRRSMLLGGLLVLPAGLVGMLGIVLSSNVLAADDSVVRSLIVLAGCALLPSLFALCLRGYARGLQAWSLIAVDQATSASFKILAISLLALTDRLTVTAATVVTSIGVFVGAFAYIPLLWRRYGEARPHTSDQVTPVDFVRYSGAIWIGAAAGILLTKLDLLLILPLSSAYVLGIYAVAVNLGDIVRIFIMSVRDVVFSSQSASVDDDSLARACRISNGLAGAFGLAVLCVSIPLVPLAFGDEFRESVPVLAVLTAGVVLGSPGSVMAAGLTARGKPMLRSIAILAGLAVDVVLVLLLVPSMGAMGAALASAFAYALSGIVVLILGRINFGLKVSEYLLPRRDDMSYLLSAFNRILRRRVTAPTRGE